MSRHGRPRSLLPIVLVVAGCGGSSHVIGSTARSPASANSAAGDGTTARPATTSASTDAGSTTSLAAPPAAAASTSATRSARATTSASDTRATPTGGAGVPPAGEGTGSGARNARVPATFRLGRGGRLTPPTVSAPAFLAIAVSVVSSDPGIHQVLIRTPSPRRITVVPDGHGGALLPGLRAGAYSIDVDGAPRGKLLIGAEPGP